MQFPSSPRAIITSALPLLPSLALAQEPSPTHPLLTNLSLHADTGVSLPLGHPGDKLRPGPESRVRALFHLTKTQSVGLTMGVNHFSGKEDLDNPPRGAALEPWDLGLTTVPVRVVGCQDFTDAGVFIPYACVELGRDYWSVSLDGNNYDWSADGSSWGYGAEAGARWNVRENLSVDGLARLSLTNDVRTRVAAGSSLQTATTGLTGLFLGAGVTYRFQ